MRRMWSWLLYRRARVVLVLFLVELLLLLLLLQNDIELLQIMLVIVSTSVWSLAAWQPAINLKEWRM